MKPNCHRATDLWPTDSAAGHRHAAVVVANEHPLRIRRHDSAPAARCGRPCSTEPVLTHLHQICCVDRRACAARSHRHARLSQHPVRSLRESPDLLRKLQQVLCIRDFLTADR